MERQAIFGKTIAVCSFLYKNANFNFMGLHSRKVSLTFRNALLPLVLLAQTGSPA